MAHDPSVRAKAEALLLSGHSLADTAEKVGLGKKGKPTVQNWKRALEQRLAEEESGSRINTVDTPRIEPARGTILQSAPGRINTVDTGSDTQKKKTRRELLDELIDESLLTIIAHLRFSRSEEWLMRQSAEGYSLMLGIEIDKAHRLLELIERSRAIKPPSGQGELPLGEGHAA